MIIITSHCPSCHCLCGAAALPPPPSCYHRLAAAAAAAKLPLPLRRRCAAATAASAIVMPAALDGAIPSLHALHEEQRLLFFAELLVRLHRWHCHEAARAETNLSVLGILQRIRNGGSGWSALAVSTARRNIWEEKTIPVPFSRAYMRGPWY